jgi:Ca-activated chloride channel family protein
MEIIFTDPKYLWLLLSIPVLVVIHFFSLRFLRTKGWLFSNYEAIKRVSGDQLSHKNSFILTKNLPLLLLQVFIVTTLVVSAANPRYIYTGQSSDQSFVLAIDTSSSMLANDFEPNRLEAAKHAASLFLQSLNASTRVGIISFSGTSFVESPMTDNMENLQAVIDGMQTKDVGGTDIGVAIITAGNLLAGEERSKTIILITDGRSTVGVPIEEGINYATKNGITVDTIGIATAAGGSFIRSDLISTIDEDSLRKIATDTQGVYVHAASSQSLVDAFDTIIKTGEHKITLDMQLPLLLVALALMFVQWALINTRYRTLP